VGVAGGSLSLCGSGQALRVRTYGFLLLALAGIAPFGVYGTLAIQRSQQASIGQVRWRNHHLAMAAAGSIRDHVTYQQRALATLGVTVLQAADPELAYDAFALDPHYEHFCEIVVYEVRDGELVALAGAPPPDDEGVLELARSVVQDGSAPLRVTRRGGDPRVGHVMTIAERIRIAGAVEGVVVAGYDLVGVWMTIDTMRIESTGFIRLISSRGETIAHGHPDERRAVFMADQKENLSLLLEAAENNQVISNRHGQDIVVSAADVLNLQWGDPGYGWSIVVEQFVDEAFAEARAMTRALIIAGLGVLLFAVAIALFIGSSLVRGLETLRAHTSELPTGLDRRLEFHSGLKELTDLAGTIERMAVDLVHERDQAQKRERLTTFAGVAAGLVHDLRQPIENVRDACESINQSPDDDSTRDWLRQVSQVDLPRLKRFIDDLQRLAHQGQLELAVESIEPTALIQDVAAEVEGARKWTEVEVETRGHAALIRGDLYLIRRAVLNLASNAADACVAKGSGNRVILEVADVGDAVEFRVIDTGQGIAPEDLARLERGDFHSTKRTTGFGLGLGVVWMVAATHEGTLTMASEAGKGSTFTLRLPLTRPPVPH
jgi:signal transduction histidine kinase